MRSLQACQLGGSDRSNNKYAHYRVFRATDVAGEKSFYLCVLQKLRWSGVGVREKDHY